MILSKTKAALFASLSRSKMRDKNAMFIAEGRKNVTDLLGKFEVEAILLKNDSDFVINADVPVMIASDSDFKKISTLSTPSDVIGIFKKPHYELKPKISGDSLYLMLDGIQDPGNLGTIIRTCHWFGIETIIASKDTVDCFNPKTVQSTMGSLGSVSVFYCDLREVILSHNGMPVYGLLLDGKDIFKSDLKKRGFIVMGNEGKGLAPETRKLVTNPLLIPPSSANHGESLNVAVATGITLAIFNK